MLFAVPMPLLKRLCVLAGKGKAAYPEGHPLTYIATSNAPLRAGKGTLYEGGIRVPLIVRWPGKIAQGTTSNHISAFWDMHLISGMYP